MADDLEAQLRAAEARSRLASLDDDTLLPEDLAAVYLNISKKILANMRANDGGPPFFKAAAKGAKAANQAVSYALGALRKWKAEHTYNNSLAANVALGIAFVAKEAPFFADKRGLILANAFDQRQPDWADNMADSIGGILDILWQDPRKAGEAPWKTAKACNGYVRALARTPDPTPTASRIIGSYLSAIGMRERTSEWKQAPRIPALGTKLIAGKDRECFDLESTDRLLHSRKKTDVLPLLDQSENWLDAYCTFEDLLGREMHGPLLEIIAMADLDPLIMIKRGIKTKKLPASGCLMVEAGPNESPLSAVATLIFYFLVFSSNGNAHQARLLEFAIRHLCGPNGWRMADSDFEEIEKQVANLPDESVSSDILEKLQGFIDSELAHRKTEIGDGIRQGKPGAILAPAGGRRHGGV